ncbi:MAG: histidine kinase [Bacteroidia bacterium]
MKSKFPSYGEIALHLLFWAVYVLSEYLGNMFHVSPGQRLEFLKSTLQTLPLLVIPVYFIALYAVPQFLQKGRNLAFLVVIVMVAFLVFFFRLRLLELINYLRENVYYRMPPSKVVKNVIRDYSVIALAVCLYIIGDWRKKADLNARLVKARADAELQLLKAQLHPHFLFNTLNNIYSQALSRSDHVADSILRLTELLDYLVYWANKEKVPLTREIQLIQNYLELERLRYGDNLQISAQLEVPNESILISPLLLLPFVENCFKHGGKGKNGKFEVKMQLQVNDRLVFLLSNSKRFTPVTKTENGGIGLENIRKRLDLIYPDSHKLEIEDNETAFCVKFELAIKHG